MAIIVSILAAAAAPQSWGLGLGEIELNSALNQNFNATIELFDASGLEPNEIIVSLGSSEDFERVGVERFFFLTGLSFQVAYAANGDPQIVVTSSRPITEPYLNFLVQVHWPNGRLLKEYTVLLDPPTFSEAAAPAVSAPSQNRAASNTGRVQRVEPASSGTRVQMNPQTAPAASGSSPLDTGFDGDQYGMTDRDDTLWSIASRARPSGAVSVHQTMLAIVRMNPDAFINGNVNLLKAGYVLRLPDEAQAQSMSQQDALLEVARQDDEWRAYNRGETIADRGTAPAAADQTSTLRSTVDASASTTPATSVKASDGELKIVAEEGDSTTGVGGQVASEKLESALEETDRLGREVEQLTYQLDREKELASNEIAVKERQIEVKDQQIAELQAQLAAAREAMQSQPESTPPTQSQNQSAQADTTPWWQSPVVMYGGAGVLVLLLVGGMVVQRRRRAAEAENDYFDAEEAFAEEERVAPSFDDFEDEDDTDRGALTDLEEDEHADEEITGSQTSDVIGEADIYIAYGRYPQAIGLLQGVLEEEPGRNDVRLKLLEVYAEAGERAAFNENMTALIEHCDDEEALLTARELENKFGEATVTLDAMMAEERAADTGVPAPEAEESDSTIEFSSRRMADESAEADAASADDTSLDFELELDELENASAADADGAGAGDQLGGDLGIDFNPKEAESDTERTIEFTSSKDEISLDDFETTEDAEADGLEVDADLVNAAAGIRGGTSTFRTSAADLEEEADGEIALEALSDDEADPLDELEFESAGRAEDDFEFEDEGDSANTKLDLARAYIDMGDADGARDILKEVLDEGNSDQQQKARSMLESL